MSLSLRLVFLEILYGMLVVRAVSLRREGGELKGEGGCWDVKGGLAKRWKLAERVRRRCRICSVEKV